MFHDPEVTQVPAHPEAAAQTADSRSEIPSNPPQPPALLLSAIRTFLAAEGDIKNEYATMDQAITALPDDPARLQACEAGLQFAGHDFKRFDRRKLRVAIMEAKVLNAPWVDSNGNALVVDQSLYIKSLHERFSLGTAPSNLSRTPNAGKIALACIEAGLPVFDYAEPFVAMAPLKVEKAVELVKELHAEFNGQFPATSVVKERVRKLRGKPKAKAKARTVTAEAVATSYTQLLKLLSGIVGAEPACEQLKAYLRNVEAGKSPIAKDAKAGAPKAKAPAAAPAAPPAPPVPEVPVPPMDPKPTPKPDYQDEVGGLRIERYKSVVQFAWLETAPDKEDDLAAFCGEGDRNAERDDACAFAVPVQGPRWFLRSRTEWAAFGLVKTVKCWAGDRSRRLAAAQKPAAQGKGGV